MAANADLDDAAKDALRDMIAPIQRLTELDATEAYMLCSLAADVRVTQLVNEQKGLPRRAAEVGTGLTRAKAPEFSSHAVLRRLSRGVATTSIQAGGGETGLAAADPGKP